MSEKKEVPKNFEAIFKWFCKKEFYEELQGDLAEEFEKDCKEKGLRKARWIYRKEILLMLRPSVIRKPNRIYIQLNGGAMFNNYLKTAFRNIRKGALFSGINIIGLSLSMAIGLLLIAGINYQFSFDSFHKNRDSIYRVITKVDDTYFGSKTYATTSMSLANNELARHEDIKTTIRINSGFGGDASTDTKTIPLSGLYANEDFLSSFSFSMIEGEATTALKDPFSVVLTQSTAYRFFKDENAVGKVLDIVGLGLFQVTGVVEDIPANSHLQFQSLASFSTIESLQAQGQGFSTFANYDNLNYGYLYVMLNENGNRERLELTLSAASKKISERYENQDFNYELQPLTAIVPGRALNNQIGPEMEILVLWIFSGLALIIIISTCFNYTNLSIARSLSRTKEIAIRKTLGGTRLQVFLQFIVEAIVLSLLALIVASLISETAKPYLYSFDAGIQKMFSFDVTLEVIGYFILFAIIVGFIAGFLPALILSKQGALDLLKGIGKFRLFKFLNLRKALIIFQFTLSLICVIMASIIVKQFRFSLTYDMGFERAQILNIQLQKTDHELFDNEYSRIPEITEVSMSSGLLAVGARNRHWMNNGFTQDSAVVNYLSVSPEYLDNHVISLVAGRLFNESDHNSQDELIIINETFVKEFGLDDPLSAIDKIIYSPQSRAFRVIGVVKDFNYDRLREPIGSFFFSYEPEQFIFANLKLNSSDVLVSMNKIETVWEKIDPIHELKAEFYDERIEEAYSFYIIAFTVVGFVALLTITIACMGLLGIVIYTSKTRTKEVAIRKVLGADEGVLVYLLSKDFIKMMVWSAIISVMFTFSLFNFLILPYEAYSAELSFWDFTLGIILILGLGLITITSQTLKIARANPVDSIHNE